MDSLPRIGRRVESGAPEKTLNLLAILDERTMALEAQLRDSLILLRIIEERSRTLEYQSSKALLSCDYQIDVQQKWYVEAMEAANLIKNNPVISESRTVFLETDHPIALASNDHLIPDSTSEGISRPTRFVRHCVDVMGEGIKCLDLGVGAGGLVFEYIMNGIFALGIDGSDYCKENRIGYWPLLPGNLYTCDITCPFQFRHVDDGSVVGFDVITMWEVLEHIEENSLDSLLNNIHAHLRAGGYFMGTISLLEYVGSNGAPYHVTLKSRPWWREKFRENDLVMLDDHPFNERLFCRGNGPRFQDFHNYFSNPHEGFHFVARAL